MVSVPNISAKRPAKPAWAFLRGAALLAGLFVLPTAVLAYAELLPASLAGLLDAKSDLDLPHVARQIAIGAPLRIVAFGSSSTQGIGASAPANAYPARLEADLRAALPGAGGVTVLNRGIGGEHVDDMLRRLDRDVIAAEPQLVIWQVGSNDPLRGVAVEHFRDATRGAVRRMQEAGIDVVLMEPQWCPKLEATPGAHRFRDAVRAVGAELDVPVIRRDDLMRGWIRDGKLTHNQLFSADGLHMADNGYAMLAEAAAAEIIEDAGPVRTAEAVAE
ncbi:SGNH/GDSL hydrolase family protein [uncultured Methylobacterium sp.]|uniref:SGNH/GDSL hydrolase family protein n=1 Tax=uncultured Methylobacterium sp. TaxID=157278 RepID=UPI0035CBD1A7